MPTFAVSRYLPDLTVEQLSALRRALTEAARRASAEGRAVRYLRSVYLPGGNRCVCYFTADDADAVARVNEVAQVPFTAIDESAALPPPEASVP
jgi:Protein of unknown function (DUF4242)